MQTVRHAHHCRKAYPWLPSATVSVAALEVDTQRKKLELILLQAEHSEYLFKRENEILDKIEQEQPLTPEERMLFLMRNFQQMNESLRQIAQNTQRD